MPPTASPSQPTGETVEPDPAAASAAHSARWRALSLCLVAGFMTLLDVSIVNVALPSIRTTLDAGDTAVQWIVAGYTLAFGMALVPAGRLGDTRSRRTVFALGLAVFTAASAACGAAPSAGWLATFRVVQGLGAGMLSPQVSGFIQTLFRGNDRARAFGLFGLTVSVSTAVGPLLGGALVSFGGADNGWRWVFLVNVPVGIVALALVRRLLPVAERGPRQSLDPLGVLLLGSAVLATLWPLVQGGSGEGAGLVGRPWWLVGVAAGLLGVFAWWERRWDRLGNAPVVQPALVRLRPYMLGVGQGALFFAGFTSVFLVLTLYLQNGLGYSALAAGLTQTPFALGSVVGAPLGGRLVPRYGRLVVVAGLMLSALGLLGLDLTVALAPDAGAAWLTPTLLLTGLGTGLTISPNVTLTLAEVDVRNAGAAGGLLQTAQRVGSAVGVALVLAQYFAALAASGGDPGAALTTGLRTTLAFVLAALVLGVVDLAYRRRADDALA
ncbi:MFS transporter [soil metagenome]